MDAPEFLMTDFAVDHEVRHSFFVTLFKLITYMGCLYAYALYN